MKRPDDALDVLQSGAGATLPEREAILAYIADLEDDIASRLAAEGRL